jgi:hypothetical protein
MDQTKNRWNSFVCHNFFFPPPCMATKKILALVKGCTKNLPPELQKELTDMLGTREGDISTANMILEQKKFSEKVQTVVTSLFSDVFEQEFTAPHGHRFYVSLWDEIVEKVGEQRLDETIAEFESSSQESAAQKAASIFDETFEAAVQSEIKRKAREDAAKIFDEMLEDAMVKKIRAEDDASVRSTQKRRVEEDNKEEENRPSCANCDSGDDCNSDGCSAECQAWQCKQSQSEKRAKPAVLSFFEVAEY